MIQICRQTRCRQNPASYNRARPHLSTAKYDNPAARVFNAMGPECVRKGRGASGAVCDLTFATSGIIRAQLSPRCHSERSGRSVTTGTQSKNPVEQPARIARKAAGFAPQSHKRLASSAFDCALRFQRTCFELELAPLGAATFLSPTEQTRGAPILWGVAPRRRATGKSPLPGKPLPHAISKGTPPASAAGSCPSEQSRAAAFRSQDDTEGKRAGVDSTAATVRSVAPRWAATISRARLASASRRGASVSSSAICS
ncbi:hypothetical protein EV701_11012 [Chthoniobacter flavus]|nr:hypothetical protein EV701_11012 [Chthoniobacter flavus]